MQFIYKHVCVSFYQIQLWLLHIVELQFCNSCCLWLLRINSYWAIYGWLKTASADSIRLHFLVKIQACLPWLKTAGTQDKTVKVQFCASCVHFQMNDLKHQSVNRWKQLNSKQSKQPMFLLKVGSKGSVCSEKIFQSGHKNQTRILQICFLNHKKSSQ